MGSKIKERIKLALLRGDKLTQADANRLPFCTSRLGAYIHKLRQEGMNIDTVMIDVKCADGHTARVAQYIYREKDKRKKMKCECCGISDFDPHKCDKCGHIVCKKCYRPCVECFKYLCWDCMIKYKDDWFCCDQCFMSWIKEDYEFYFHSYHQLLDFLANLYKNIKNNNILCDAELIYAIEKELTYRLAEINKPF